MRLSMRKTYEILRLKLSLELSHREVATRLSVSVGVVSKVVNRAAKAGLSWAEVEPLDEEQLDVRLNGPRLPTKRARPLPDVLWMHQELAKTGVTLELLHLEYLAANPDGYRYTQFCEQYRRWLKKRKLSMKQRHIAGEKLFVDYSGKKPHIIDRKTGEHIEVELFVGVLGASNYTYAEATLTQRGLDFVESHVRCFEFLGGVTKLVVPDQLKSGVTRACLYEPTIQRTYEEMGQHYDVAVFPARPRRPKDKAKVEGGVLIVQRWILARLRNEQFFSLDELNARIAELLDDLNARPMKKYGGKSRKALFAEVDQPALRALPEKRFVYGEWKHVRANIDYHVDVKDHRYSVPYTLVHEELDARFTSSTVEVFKGGKRVAVHRRSFIAGGFTTLPEHMPRAHRAHAEWTPSRMLNWAASIGPHTKLLVAAILKERPHPEQGYRSCLGIFRLGKRYGNDRLERACKRTHEHGGRSYRHVENILKSGLDRALDDEGTAPIVPAESHINVRGPAYYKEN